MKLCYLFCNIWKSQSIQKKKLRCRGTSKYREYGLTICVTQPSIKHHLQCEWIWQMQVSSTRINSNISCLSTCYVRFAVDRFTFVGLQLHAWRSDRTCTGTIETNNGLRFAPSMHSSVTKCSTELNGNSLYNIPCGKTRQCTFPGSMFTKQFQSHLRTKLYFPSCLKYWVLLWISNSNLILICNIVVSASYILWNSKLISEESSSKTSTRGHQVTWRHKQSLTSYPVATSSLFYLFDTWYCC